MAIELIAKIKQKNNGAFALVDAQDVELSGGKRLDVKITELESSLGQIDQNIIDDNSAQSNKTYSSQKIVSEIAAKCEETKNALLGGAGDAYDTLKELADLINTNKTALEALQELAGAHIRYDQAQSLEPTQKQQARENIGAADAAIYCDLSTLTTDAKTTVVAAINEVDAHADAAQSKADQNATQIGTLTSLATDAKSDLVSAVNEVNTNADAAQAKANENATTIGTVSTLTTDAKTSVVAAVNEVDAHADAAQVKADQNATQIGTIGSLSTTAKNNLVAAVNEVHTSATKANTDLTALKTSLGNLNQDFVAIFEAALEQE